MPRIQTLDRPTDRRRHFRRPVNLNAELTLPTGEAFFDCTIVDESDGGLQVELAEEVELPDEVVIRFSNHASQLVRRCWSLGTKVGFQFIQPAPAHPRTIEAVPPPAREARTASAPLALDEPTAITPIELGLHFDEMAFEYPGQRINALLRMSLLNKA